jgi:hypothetical protein
MNAVDQSTALHAIKDLFRDYPRPYWVAGSWALDCSPSAPEGHTATSICSSSPVISLSSPTPSPVHDPSCSTPRPGSSDHG